MLTHTITIVTVTSDLADGIAFAARLERDDSTSYQTWRRKLLLPDALYAQSVALATALDPVDISAAPGDRVVVRSAPFIDFRPALSGEEALEAVYRPMFQEITRCLARILPAPRALDQAPATPCPALLLAATQALMRDSAFATITPRRS